MLSQLALNFQEIPILCIEATITRVVFWLVFYHYLYIVAS